MFISKGSSSDTQSEARAAWSAAGHGAQPGAHRPAAAASADVTFHHAPARAGEVLHVYVDGAYYRAVPLSAGCAETQVHVDGKSWRSPSSVHAVDAYQASANGRVIEHQSVMVTASANWAGAPQAQAQDRIGTGAAHAQADVDAVEYRVSRAGQPFGEWHSDYAEPASDGSEDGEYVVQMRFLDAKRRVLGVQTLRFEVRAGVVCTS
jgi:hypothetical protein